MPKLERFDKLQQTLRRRIEEVKRDGSPSVTVGYTQQYACFVHENLEAQHPTGQAKFLETPARTLQSVLAAIVREALQGGKRVSQALLLAGLRLQRESMRLVPVDTGALRASAFTRLDQTAK